MSDPEFDEDDLDVPEVEDGSVDSSDIRAAEEALDELANQYAELPDYIVSRVEKLKDLHEKKEQFMSEYLKERAALEAKYQQLYQPLYKERMAIVRGDQDADITAGEDLDENKNNTQKDEDNAVGDDKEEEKESSTEAQPQGGGGEGNEQNQDGNDGIDKIVGIPQFWVCAMGHMESIGSLITEDDVDCLEKLEDITCIDDEDGKGFTLRFFFAPNDYFHDTVLTKKYQVPNLLTGDEPILKNVSGCTIQWKPDKCLTYRTVQKKQRGKGKHAGQVRTVTKKERKESFFHWFDPPSLPSMEEMDQEEVELLEDTFDQDYDIAQSFRLHIIPTAVLWFTGEALDKELDNAIEEN